MSEATIPGGRAGVNAIQPISQTRSLVQPLANILCNCNTVPFAYPNVALLIAWAAFKQISMLRGPYYYRDASVMTRAGEGEHLAIPVAVSAALQTVYTSVYALVCADTV